MYFIYKTTFGIEYDNNFLCFDNYFYKCKDFRDIFFNLDIYSIMKKYFLNHFIISEYQTLLIDQVLKNKLREKNTKARPFFN